MIKFDLQLFGGFFGGGGGGTQVIEKPVVQQSAPSSSPVQTTSDTASEKATKKSWQKNLRGRASTITGAGNSALTAASSIAKTLLGETPQRKTLGGA